MRLSIAEDEIAEILVVGQDDAPLGKRDRQDFAVIQRVGMVAPADGDVVPLVLEECREAERETFVKEKPHSGVGAATSCGFGIASTSLCANAKHALTSSIVSLG